METVIITKVEYNKLKRDSKLLKNLEVYNRLLEFEKNVISDKKYFRKDLGF